MKTFNKLAAMLLLVTAVNAANAQNVTISAGALDCDNYGNNDILFSPKTFPGNSTEQTITVTFAQYQCERCKQIVFTKNDGSPVNLVKDAASGAFPVTGIQRNPAAVSHVDAAGNKLTFNGMDCGWDVGNISITLHLKYEEATNTLYFSSGQMGAFTGIKDWNNLWEGGFYDAENAANAPESEGWFWGINMNHTPNTPTSRLNGQIVIKNSPDSPTMYFRSTNTNGAGVWAKVLQDTGNQRINGKLEVNGIVQAREVVVNTGTGADFVFEENYALRPLDEVSDFIQANKHLPEIPPAAHMVANGVDMGEFQIKLLQKIEELTLYIIEQDKRIKELENK